MVTVAELADPGNYYFWIITVAITIAILGILKSKIQMLFTITSFAYPNAKFNAIGNDYVKKAEVEALIEARSFQDAIGILGTRKYPIKDVKNTNEVEKILDEHNIKTLEGIYQDIPEGLHPLVNIYLKKYEVKIIKSILKSRLAKGRARYGAGSTVTSDKGLGSSYSPVGDLTNELIQQMLDAERADEIADIFSKTPFGKELREAIHEYDGNFQRIENIMDKYVYSELRGVDNRVSSTVSEPTRFFINHLLDIANIKMLLRAKRKGYNSEICKNMLFPPGISLSTWKLEQMCEASDVTELATELEGTKYFPVIKEFLSDYEDHGNVSPLEIALDKYLLRLVIEVAIQYTTTAGPTIRYMVSREYETRNLKTVLRGLGEGLDYKRIMPLVVTEEDE